MSADNLAIGAVFAERYKVIQRIAAGGMGAVYEVEHLGTERRRALKVMHPHLVSSDELRQRFQQEAKVAAQIKSKYIVDVFDTGIDAATSMPFLVMELLRGEELGRRLKRVGRFSAEETVHFLRQTAVALDKTHQANIVHRDLKPDNLFLCEDDEGPAQIKVLDFGIAKFVAEGGTQANATRSLGTPLYMAPEQFRHGSTVTPATDIFSLGMMAYTLLVGTSYWAEEQAKDGNIYSFVGLALHGPQEAPSERAKRRGIVLPVAFDDWFRKMTSEKPDQRFSSASVAIAALAETLNVGALGTTGAPVATGLRLESPTLQLTPPERFSKSSDISARTPSKQATSTSQPQGLVAASTSQSSIASVASQPSLPSNGFGMSSSKSAGLHDQVGSTSVNEATLHEAGAKHEERRSKRMALIVAGSVGLCCVVIGIAALVLKEKSKAPTEFAIAPVITPQATSVTVTPIAPASTDELAIAVETSPTSPNHEVAPPRPIDSLGLTRVPASASPPSGPLQKVISGPKPSSSAKPTAKPICSGFGC